MYKNETYQQFRCTNDQEKHTLENIAVLYACAQHNAAGWHFSSSRQEHIDVNGWIPLKRFQNYGEVALSEDRTHVQDHGDTYAQEAIHAPVRVADNRVPYSQRVRKGELLTEQES